ncbi:MAG TPA: hypothetical protein VEV17_07135 [Bryobacteraceae bacterium]|nr:hypothetical protein [Bryobacteraceae bacterium]
MGIRTLASTAALVAALTASLPGQTKPAASKAKNWTMPRTPDGHPDFQGIWTNATLTPLERGVVVAITGERVKAPAVTTLTISDDLAAAYEKQIKDVGSFDRRDGGNDTDVNRAYNQLFIDRGNELARVDGSKRTSLIIDPLDGKIPPLTEEARARAGRRPVNRFDSVEDRPLGERCITGFGSTVGPPMLPVGYNNNYQIIQTPGYVMIMTEMIHEVRVIHMDGRPHLPQSIRLWLGDSLGHWEGDTLVVETTNFTNKTRFRGSDENLRVIEHFKRIDAGTILYRFTIDDPSTYTKPWTAEYPFRATPGPIFEYACHEGNYAEADILAGARKTEAETKAK